MQRTVSVMDGSGDFEIKWDGSKAESVAEARAALEDIKRRGYQFFLVDGTPADAPPPGVERMNVRRVADVEEVIGAPVAAKVEETPPAKGRRGKCVVTTAPAHAVATRPMRGG